MSIPPEALPFRVCPSDMRKHLIPLFDRCNPNGLIEPSVCAANSAGLETEEFNMGIDRQPPSDLASASK